MHNKPKHFFSTLIIIMLIGFLFSIFAYADFPQTMGLSQPAPLALQQGFALPLSVSTSMSGTITIKDPDNVSQNLSVQYTAGSGFTAFANMSKVGSYTIQENYTISANNALLGNQTKSGSRTTTYNNTVAGAKTLKVINSTLSGFSTSPSDKISAQFSKTSIEPGQSITVSITVTQNIAAGTNIGVNATWDVSPLSITDGGGGGANTPPSIIINTATQAQANADVSISYTLTDAEGNPCSISAQYSEDGINWSSATLIGETSNVTPGSKSVVWKSTTDLPNALGSFQIRLRANDGTNTGNWSSARSVLLDNYTGPNTPPSVLNLRIITVDPITNQEVNREPVTGDKLKAEYDFKDNENNVERGSELVWIRNGVAQPKIIIQTPQDKILVLTGNQTIMRGEKWEFSVKPKDGREFGTERTSNPKTIGNAPPKAQNPTIKPFSPKADDNLEADFTYSDPENDTAGAHEYQWYKVLPNQTQFTLQASYKSKILPKEATNKGERWKFAVTPKDSLGAIGTRVESSSVLIANQNPAIQNIRIPEGILTGDITVTFDLIDLDGDACSLTVWYKGNVEKRSATVTEAGQDRFIIKNVKPGKDLKLTWRSKEDEPSGYGNNFIIGIIPDDGFKTSPDVGEGISKQFTLDNNEEPVAKNPVIRPANPRAADEITANYDYSDANNDAESGSRIRWYRNKVEQNALRNKKTLDKGTTKRDEEWYFTVEPSDGKEFGKLVQSPTVKIINSPPMAVNVKLEPVNATSEDNLTAVYNYADADEDPEDGTEIRWYIDGIEKPEYNDQEVISKEITLKDQMWFFRVRVSDGTDFDEWRESNRIKIGNVAPKIENLVFPDGDEGYRDVLIEFDLVDPNNEKCTLTVEYRGGRATQWTKATIKEPLTGISPGRITLTWESHKDQDVQSSTLFQIRITPDDGSGVPGLPVESSFIKLDNNIPPVATNLKISPENPKTTDNLVASYDYSDGDGGLESGSEILWYKKDGVTTDFKGKVLASSVTARGDSWHFTVRPKDGSRFGKVVKSSAITIANSPPIVLSADILPANPKSNGTLTARYDYRDVDNDREAGTELEWYMNDELRLKKIVNSEQDKVLPLPISKGEKWHIVVKPKDGVDFGETVKSNVVGIDNAPPKIENFTVSGSAGNIMITLDLIDTDGDLCDLKIEYQGGTVKTSWVKATIKESIEKVTPGKEWKFTWLSQEDERGNKSDDYRIRITPSDGIVSGESVVSSRFVLNNNSEPSAANLAILPEKPTTSDNLVVNYVFVDADGDNEGNPEIKWYKNGILEIIHDNRKSLSSSATKKGDRWHYTIKVYDNKDYGKLQMSPDTVIYNAPPTAVEVKLLPEFPNVGQSLVVGYQYRDADDDREQGTKIEWYRNGVYEKMYDDYKTIPGAVTLKGEEWYFVVKPSDGVDLGLPVQSNKVYVGNTPPDASSLVILPVNPLTTDDLRASYVYVDAESDPEKDTRITWFKNNVVQTQFNDLLVVPSSATSRKQVWYFTVQPKDGKQYGTLKQSNYVVIGNTPPRVDNLSITPAYPQKGDDLVANYEYYDVDNDPEGRSEIKWYRNNVWVADYDGLKRIPNRILSDREIWHFTVRPKDDELFGSVQTSKSVDIGNPIPRVNNLFVTPENPFTTDDLTANYTYMDPNNIPESGSLITWYKNGEVKTEYNDLKTLPSSATVKGDRWHFVVKPRNSGRLFGEEQASPPNTISNSPPILRSVMPRPQQPTTNDNLIADYQFTDADGDIEIRNEIRWYRNGVIQTSYNDLTEITASSTNRNEEWYYTVRASDGTSFSESVTSGKVKILNGKPHVTKPVIIPDKPKTNDNLMVEYEYSDTENDQESGTDIKWFKNNVNQTQYHNMRVVPASATTKGDKWHCVVEPNDGIDFGLPATSSIVVIENTSPVVLDITASASKVFRGKIATIRAYAKDADEIDLGPSMRCRISYRILSGAWVELTTQYVENPSPHWESTFSPDEKAILGDYDFRTKFIDSSEAESEWFEKPRLVVVENSPPVISADADNFRLQEDTIKEFDLSPFGSDFESGKNVTWDIDPDSVNKNLFNAVILRGKILEIKPVDDKNGSDDITLILTDTDGGRTEKTNVTIIVDPVNDPPSAPASVKIMPEVPNTLDNLVCTASGSIDIDGDNVIYRYQWYKNNELQADQKSPDVHYSLTAKGEVWKCEVTPSDGKVDGISRSAEVTIGNVIPTVNNIRTSGNTKDIIVTYELDDPDADLCDIKFEYRVKGGTWKTATTSQSLLGIAPGKDLKITWQSIKDFPNLETDECKIRITANDRILPSETKESLAFLLDNKAPEFTITAVVNPIHKSYVDISVISHEELNEKAPKVNVSLGDQEPIDIEMNKVGNKIWTGLLKLNSGFDGNVMIGASGTDLYGNSSEASIQRAFKIPSADPKPTKFTLNQNYPNPIVQDTMIPFELTESAVVVVRIYSITGKLIRTIDVGYKSAGFYNTKDRAAYWDGRDDFGLNVASGAYFYHLRAGSSEGVKKMFVQR